MGDLAMDSELKSRLSGIVRQLAEQEHQRLRAAGTIVELEELACEIGDEVTRQLMSGALAERSSRSGSGDDGRRSLSTSRSFCSAWCNEEGAGIENPLARNESRLPAFDDQ